jgi:two-component system, chemotaxis family, protein-glutamate methylesterase/glutaminase
MKAPQWIVVLGGSAGGLESLRELLRSVPTELDAAFLVVLHVPAHSPSHLDRILASDTQMPVLAPKDGDVLKRGHVYVASSDQHMMLEDGTIRQTRGPKECRARPSIDVLFRSASVIYGPRTIGIVLSGLLDDGTAGLWAIKDSGGFALVQDPQEAMYSPMPESAMRHVKADVVGSCSVLARAISDIASKKPAERRKERSVRLETENRIASEGNGLQLGVMKMGKVSQYTCPDCHGVLVQIEEGTLVRFRCHTGHAFSLRALLAEVSESIDKGLWDTVRAIEERVLLLRQMSDLESEETDGKATAFNELADAAEHSIVAIKDLVMDVRLFGRQG